MKWMFLVDGVVLSAVMLMVAQPAPTPPMSSKNQAIQAPPVLTWITDYPLALARASKEHKMILLDFTGSDWCTACQELHAHVFAKPEFARWAAEKVILVEVDFPNKTPISDSLKKQNAVLKSRFWVFGYPTVVIIDPGETAFAYHIGYAGATAQEWVDGRDENIAASRDAMAHAAALRSKQ